MTKVPSVSRAVEAASAANSVHPSAMPSTGCPGGSDSRWSHTHAESRPAASACCATALTSSQVGIRPGPSETDIGTIIPIRTSPP